MESKHDNPERQIRQCCACGATFQASGNNHRCNPCRAEYSAAWREKRRAMGLKACGSKTWNPEKKAAFLEAYYNRPDVKARRAAQMRQAASRPEIAERRKARRMTRSAIERGLLQRNPCEVCGHPHSEAHHDDYSRPLDVRWLCRPHHVQLHRARAEGGV